MHAETRLALEADGQGKVDEHQHDHQTDEEGPFSSRSDKQRQDEDNKEGDQPRERGDIRHHHVHRAEDPDGMPQ